MNKRRNDFCLNPNDLGSNGFIPYHKTEGSDCNVYVKHYVGDGRDEEVFHMDGKTTANVARRHDLKGHILGTDTCFDITDANLNNEMGNIETHSNSSYGEQISFRGVLDKAISHFQDLDWDQIAVRGAIASLNPEVDQSFEQHIHIIESMNEVEDSSVPKNELSESKVVKVLDLNRLIENRSKVKRDVGSQANLIEGHTDAKDRSKVPASIEGFNFNSMNTDQEFGTNNKGSRTERKLKEDQNQDKISVHRTTTIERASAEQLSKLKSKSQKIAIILPNKAKKEKKENMQSSDQLNLMISCLNMNKVKRQSRRPSKSKSQAHFHSNIVDRAIFESNATNNTLQLKKEDLMSDTKMPKGKKNSQADEKKLKRCKSTKKKLFEDVACESNIANQKNSQTSRQLFIKKMVKNLACRNTVGVFETDTKNKAKLSQRNDDYKIAYKILHREFIDLTTKYEVVSDNYNKIVNKLESSKTYSANEHGDSYMFNKKRSTVAQGHCGSSSRLTLSQVKEYIKLIEKDRESFTKKTKDTCQVSKTKPQEGKHWKFKSADLSQYRNDRGQGLATQNINLINDCKKPSKDVGHKSLRANNLQAKSGNVNSLVLSTILRRGGASKGHHYHTKEG